MDTVEFQGAPGDLARFADQVLKEGVSLEQLSPFEQRLHWNVAGTSGFGSATRLRSGITLSTARLRWENPWCFQFQDTAPLKFMLCAGNGPRLTRGAGSAVSLEDQVLQVSHAACSDSTLCEFLGGSAEFEQLSLEIDPDRLRELLGGPALPSQLETLLKSGYPYALHRQPMTARMGHLLEELLHLDARGATRQLLLEARGLEILALLIDELGAASEGTPPPGARDRERLERARSLLLRRMEHPPTLHELGRAVGLNECALKSGFRSLFGTSVFGYLRAQRMERARSLLARKELSIAEIALRVGYANPSKFAAAFRRHFGVPPSAMR